MMYNNQFVSAIKCNGKVLREQKDTVFLPFGSEYSIFLKNLNTKRAAVRISIDGNDVLGGHQLVIDGNSELNLERFLTDSMYEGRRFKFIERTQDIEDHRGVGAEDGIVRVEFQYEAMRPVTTWVGSTTWVGTEPYGDKWWYTSNGIGSGSYTADSHSLVSNTAAGSNSLRGIVNTAYNCDAKSVATPRSDTLLNDAGITAEGSKSTQSFFSTSLGTLESESHAIVFQLKGETAKAIVQRPVTVKSRKYCPMCGRRYGFRHEYCSHDGAFLKTEQFAAKVA